MTVRPTTEHELTRWLVGDSAATNELRQMILRIGPSSVPVWIDGETGVGKEQVALALHAASGRTGAFVAFNVCALSESMFEDALFGHERGAFTGAHSESSGYLGEADAGTLFLDEIGGLSLPAQVKLLRAIETKRYRRIGGRLDRASDFRVIAASNEPFESLLRQGRFRADLGFRLRGAAFRVPSLRVRQDDIPALVAHFLSSRDAEEKWSVEDAAISWLRKQRWLGNVRELRQLLACAQVLASSSNISADDLRAAHAMLGVEDVGECVIPLVTDDAERAELFALLMRSGWDTAVVAGTLGVDRTTVYRRMRRLRIEAPRSSRGSRTTPLAPLERPMGEDQRSSMQ